ncbi:MAG: thermonuclease family protein [Polyangiaceae bacterium]|nr:thermonuclease family protein [Polyangiaceae bacterium]
MPLLTRSVSALTLVTLAIAGCSSPAEEADACGPTRAVVARAIDGDTIELESGERVRYLMIDTPESTNQDECWGEEAKAVNEALVLGQEITLTYDAVCTDRYGRLLAYVALEGYEINLALVEHGHACVLYLPPNGDHSVEDFEAAEELARRRGSGLWGACVGDLPC